MISKLDQMQTQITQYFRCRKWSKPFDWNYVSILHSLVQSYRKKKAEKIDIP